MPFFSRLYYWLVIRRKLRELPDSPFQEHKRPSFYSQATLSDVAGLEFDESSRGVGQFIPAGFESYLWLPNPAWKWVAPETEGAVPNRPSSDLSGLWVKRAKWSEVAEANNKRMNKDTGWYEICGPCTESGRWALSPDQNWTWAPVEDSFEPEYANDLFDILSPWTSMDDRCLCGQWEGSSTGWDSKVRTGTRSWTYDVWSCRLGDLIDWSDSTESFDRANDMPNVIWPEDRVWFLSILYSAHWNYFAGSRKVVDAILASDIEAYEIAFDDQSP